MRNVLAASGKSGECIVSAFLGTTVIAQGTPEVVSVQGRVDANQFWPATQPGI
jgi:hypothetical protein